MTLLLLLLMQSCRQAPTAENKKKKEKKKLAADLPTAESKLYTTVTTLKSIVLDLFFFYLKWHRASLLCFWIEC